MEHRSEFEVAQFTIGNADRDRDLSHITFTFGSMELVIAGSHRVIAELAEELSSGNLGYVSLLIKGARDAS